MREIHLYVPSHTPSTGDLACNPGMCPDWELNRRPFGSQASTQSSELHQPGKINTIFKKDRDNRLYFIYLFLERGEGREKEERNIYAWLPPALPLLGTWPGLQPGHVPWLAIEPETLWFAGQHSIHWATPARANLTTSLKTLSPNTVHSQLLEFRASTYEFWAGDMIQPLTHKKKHYFTWRKDRWYKWVALEITLSNQLHLYPAP